MVDHFNIAFQRYLPNLPVLACDGGQQARVKKGNVPERKLGVGIHLIDVCEKSVDVSAADVQLIGRPLVAPVARADQGVAAPGNKKEKTFSPFRMDLSLEWELWPSRPTAVRSTRRLLVTKLQP